jgi:hypothetical protein
MSMWRNQVNAPSREGGGLHVRVGSTPAIGTTIQKNMLLELRWTERPSRKREAAGSNPAESSRATVNHTLVAQW